jgi:membrane peptidoglycan carboxypeptidase
VGKRRGRFARFVRWVVVVLVLVAVAGAGTLVFLYDKHVVKEPGEHLDRAYIHRLISQESPVYYRDGTTKIGVFFDDQHRQYVPFERMPRMFVDALVSGEDQDFWTHRGFSARGISRAMIQNFKAGRVVAGGSTLTQQTAKNLFKRRARTYTEKLKELVNGLRLEAHFTKEEILEFYSNQFYVNGNGRGLAIAARFFFDKDVGELDLLECAFLAGVVKSPERYNPWVSDPDRAERNRARSRDRVAYVLGRMLEDEIIDADQHRQALDRELPFVRGRFRYARSVVLDEVERELGRSPIREVLAAHGIEDPGTAGLMITTTLDRETQEGSVYALRHHLSDVGTQLEAPEPASLFVPGTNLRPADPDMIRPRTFHRGILLSVDPKKRTARVDLGGVEGTLDPAANLRMATALAKAKAKNTWTQAKRKDVQAFLTGIEEHVGKGLSVSIRSLAEDGTPILDWETERELQGAVLVLDRGEVRAMVGGARNADFNRAAVARRQFGSTWKPFIFQAALQLGWSSMDELPNVRALFPYQTTFYYPRPDHRGAPETVSMAWAAVKSENLASVGLLYTLTDRLNDEQFRRVAGSAGMLLREGESRGEFVRRIQDEGVLPTETKLLDGLFDRVKADLTVDLTFDGLDREAEVLRSLRYGNGFASEVERLAENPDKLRAEELAVRRELARRCFLRQERIATTFSNARKNLLEIVRGGDTPPVEALVGLFLVPDPGPTARIGWAEVAPDGWEPITPELLQRLLAGESPLSPGAEEPEGSIDEEPDPFDVAAAEQEELENDPEPTPDEVVEAPPDPSEGPRAGAAFRWIELLDPARVSLEGLLTPRIVERVRASVSVARRRLGAKPELYSPSLLAYCRDYRTLVNLRYIERLARRAGVRSEITPVLSLPLGSSDVTLLEAALMYQLILRGEVYRFFADALVPVPALPEDAPPPSSLALDALPSVSLVKEVRTAEGLLVFRLDRDAVRVHDPALSAEITAMLKAVIDHGTGRRARGRVHPTSARPERAKELADLGVALPLFGKTGTTNSYRNSAFVGFVPGIPDGGDRLTAADGMVVATYVGYDDNREMRRGSIRLQGASGSLPVWIEAAAAAVRGSELGERLDLADLAFSGVSVAPVRWPPELIPIEIDLRTGLPIDASAGDDDDSAGGPADPKTRDASSGTTILYRRRQPRTFAPLAPEESTR